MNQLRSHAILTRFVKSWISREGIFNSEEQSFIENENYYIIKVEKLFYGLIQNLQDSLLLIQQNSSNNDSSTSRANIERLCITSQAEVLFQTIDSVIKEISRININWTLESKEMIDSLIVTYNTILTTLITFRPIRYIQSDNSNVDSYEQIIFPSNDRNSCYCDSLFINMFAFTSFYDLLFDLGSNDKSPTLFPEKELLNLNPLVWHYYGDIKAIWEIYQSKHRYNSNSNEKTKTVLSESVFDYSSNNSTESGMGNIIGDTISTKLDEVVRYFPNGTIDESTRKLGFSDTLDKNRKEVRRALNHLVWMLRGFFTPDDTDPDSLREPLSKHILEFRDMIRKFIYIDPTGQEDPIVMFDKIIGFSGLTHIYYPIALVKKMFTVTKKNDITKTWLIDKLFLSSAIYYNKITTIIPPLIAQIEHLKPQDYYKDVKKKIFDFNKLITIQFNGSTTLIPEMYSEINIRQDNYAYNKFKQRGYVPSAFNIDQFENEYTVDVTESFTLIYLPDIITIRINRNGEDGIKIDERTILEETINIPTIKGIHSYIVTGIICYLSLVHYVTFIRLPESQIIMNSWIYYNDMDKVMNRNPLSLDGSSGRNFSDTHIRYITEKSTLLFLTRTKS